jgi:hypothetical protein
MQSCRLFHPRAARFLRTFNIVRSSKVFAMLVKIAVPDSIRAGSGRFMAKNKLALLPAELLAMISSYLPVSALIAMKLVDTELYQMIALPRWYHGKQAFRALCSREKADVRRALHERREKTYGRRRCRVCETLQPIHCFPKGGYVCDFHDVRLAKCGPESEQLDACVEGLRR